MAVWRYISVLLLTLCVVLKARAAPIVQIDGRRALFAAKASSPNAPTEVTSVPTAKITLTSTQRALSSASISVTSTPIKAVTSSVSSSSSLATTSSTPTASTRFPGQPSKPRASAAASSSTSLASSSTARNVTSSVTSTAVSRNATVTSVASNGTNTTAVCARPLGSGTKTRRVVAAPFPTTEGGAIPNKFTVLLNPGVDTEKHMANVQLLMKETAACDSVISTIDGTVPLDTLGIYSATLGPKMLALLQEDANVESIEPDVLLGLNRPLEQAVGKLARVRRTLGLFSGFRNFRGTWNLFRLTQRDKVSPGAQGQGTAIDLTDWTFRQDKNSGKDVTVFVVDSGVSPHEEFGTRLKPGFNVIPGVDPTNTRDDVGHGTAVAGIIAGKGCGVAKAVNIVPIKIFSGLSALSSSGLYAGISKAITASAGKGGVINISISLSASRTMKKTVAKTLASNLHLVIAAGNGVQGKDGKHRGIDVCKTNNVVSKPDLPLVVVGATDSTDALAVFSNFGSCVDLFAPGQDILVPSNTRSNMFLQGNRGTSYSAPLVAGILASAIAKSPGLSPAAGKAQLLANTIPAVQLSPEAVKAQTPNRLPQIPQV